jgi:hypothetical protein
MSDDNLLHFKLRPTPNDASETQINNLWDFATSLMKQSARAAFNAETMFIDLQRPYKIKAERRPSLHRLPEWFAIDENTFDPDPGSRWHIVGTGECEQDAKMDLLALLHEEFSR